MFQFTVREDAEQTSHTAAYGLYFSLQIQKMQVRLYIHPLLKVGLHSPPLGHHGLLSHLGYKGDNDESGAVIKLGTGSKLRNV
jgi:hypothetical protein